MGHEHMRHPYRQKSRSSLQAVLTTGNIIALDGSGGMSSNTYLFYTTICYPVFENMKNIDPVVYCIYYQNWYLFDLYYDRTWFY